ncbi:MAG: glycosyltransferase family 4 protein [Flaviramulus sp.]|nr:glycosyltransferase family 4 protein [Flaviramulus sp.]
MLKHKRGVENVIDFQSKASASKINYYIHWDNKTSVYRYKDFICIGIKADFFKFFVFNWFILRIKRKEKSIFIHSHNTLMSMTCFLKTNLFSVHDALYYQNKVNDHYLKTLFYPLEIYLYKRVNFVHFISDFTKKMSLFSKNENFIILPNTSHLEDYLNDEAQKENKSLLIAFNTTKIKVFVVRSMEKRSRIDLLIKVAEQLKESDFELFIAGTGPLYNQYKNQIKTLGLQNIKLLGYINDEHLMSYYSNCDVVLMTSEFAEGFGLPIIEGYLFNKPVIASKKCAIPEVIISDEFLFENTVNSIIEKLNIARQKLTGSYKEYYDKNFSNKIVISQFSSLYKKLM